MLGGNAARLANGEHPPTMSPPRPHTRTIHQPISLARIHSYLTMTTTLLWTRQPDVIGALGLALNAADERDGHVEVRDRIAELLSCAQELWRSLPELDDPQEQTRRSRLLFRLIHLADIEALTTPA